MFYICKNVLKVKKYVTSAGSTVWKDGLMYICKKEFTLVKKNICLKIEFTLVKGNLHM